MKKIRLFFLLFICFFLVSCSSFTDLVRAQVEGLPSWIYAPPQRSGEISYVGKGSASFAYNARLRSYEHILAQISTFVGEDVRDTYYRELTTTNAIEDLGLTIASEFTYSDRGTVEVYLLARMREDRMISKRTSVFNETLQRGRQIASLIQQGDRAYRANDDTQAIKLYLEAALIASEGPVLEKRHEVDALLDKAQTFIEALYFSLRNPNSSQGRVTVFVRRKSRLLSPKVLNAPVLASTKARNSLGKEYTDFLQFNTANQGFFEFVPYNMGILKEGEIFFSLDLSDTVKRLEQRMGEQRLRSIREAVESIQIVFPYSFSSPIRNQVAVMSIKEFALDGSLLTSSDASVAFEHEMAVDTVRVTRTSLSSGDLEDQLQEITRNHRDAEYAFLGSVGVVSQERIQQTWVVVANGSVVLYALPSKNVLNDTFPIEAVGSGSTLQEAREQAFKRFGSVASYLSSAYLFKR